MFLRTRFYLLLLAIALVTGLGYAYAPLYTVGRALTLLLFMAVVADITMLWHKRAITADRKLSSRFSNGDDNPVTINVESSYPFPVRIKLIDELPFSTTGSSVATSIHCAAELPISFHLLTLPPSHFLSIPPDEESTPSATCSYMPLPDWDW